ncbi:MAG: cyclic pyranopterin monophosphate synthase MoaC [Lachnospirales bacterium]
MGKFTHFNNNGDAVMVDITNKADTKREALACGKIYMSESCFEMVKSGNMGKGDVLAVARIAGIMAAKKTSDIIPLCHIINLTKVEIDFEFNTDNSITAFCKAKTTGKTGVEMEALTGVSACLLTIYDMCKAVDKFMKIENICLLKKSGGKSGNWQR